MAGLTAEYSKTVLDTSFGSGDHIAYSANGSSASSALARSAITWGAATTASPSVKANSVTLTSAAASAAVTVTHFAVFSAASGGTQKTLWTPLATSRQLALGDQLVFAVGALSVTLD